MPFGSTDLSKLALAGFRNIPEGVVFIPMRLAKQFNPNGEIKEFFFSSFKEDKRLCLVYSLSLYIERTWQIRGGNTQLFIATMKPHLPVTSCTIARWLKNVTSNLGIDSNIFKAHSVRSACTSAASNLGLTIQKKF